jgi:hypothetical protein
VCVCARVLYREGRVRVDCVTGKLIGFYITCNMFGKGGTREGTSEASVLPLLLGELGREHKANNLVR